MAQIMLRDYLQITEDAISSGQIDEALANCQHILTYFPESLEAQRLLGEVYMAQGHLEEAQQTFDWILANDPENVIVYCDRALVSEHMSDIETALDCYQQAYELSRGNKQIRQEFNTLSAKVGQQDFMFSRAGLARLYMRGDLLTQAIQEWEAVLSVSPDRLDARTGLLETYWREGLYDQVQQLATQILEDIPTCLKALLLLAHVTSVYNISQAQELLQRAETIDPEFIMAQELFSDLIASQPNDPFLALLRKDSVVLPDAADSTPLASSEYSPVPANGTLSPAISSGSLFDWGTMESWSELDPAMVSQQDSPDIATWSGDSIQDIDKWATLGEMAKIEPELEAWQEEQAADEDYMPAVADEQEVPQEIADQELYSTPSLQQETWDSTDQPAEQVPAFAETWGTTSSEESVKTWGTEARETDIPLPPVWLNMLTKSERSQAVDGIAESSTPSQEQEEVFTAAPEPTQQEEETIFTFTSEDNDAEMGWPEWLKSLGAATLEPESQAEPSFLLLEPEVSSQGVQNIQEEIPPEPQVEQTVESVSETEQEQLTTLENLENDLQVQGFVPLEPGTLSTIAEETSLSSAFAQLGTTPPQQTPSTAAVDAQEASWATHEVPPEPNVEAEFIVPTQDEPEAPVTDDINVGAPGGAEERDFQSFAPASSQEAPDAPSTSDNATASDEEKSSSDNNTPAVQENAGLLAYNGDMLLEDELEMTMRRPAIRVQPTQTRTSTQQNPAVPVSRGRSPEHSTSGKLADSTSSYKERLLRGYQYQLAGSYDSAMQEYRLIIRGAPDLLDEVISNVRALLKLVPKYSLGYRVLGDAYMRQGEYLQAMEAYNKALTMAKKAKSQV